MTFPLGSLGSDGAASSNTLHTASYRREASGARAAPPPAAHHASWRTQLALLAGGVLWLLAVLALATHSGADAAFSTSGSSPVVLNQAGPVGAWFSDFAYFTLGYSVWWAVAVALRAWLGALAVALRGEHAAALPAASSHRPSGLFWLGLALLLAGSAALEWTRLYQWEGVVAGGRAGGVLGYTLGQASQQLLGFAGSGVLWIAALVAGVSLAFHFSWLGVAEAIGGWVDSLRERRVERIERAEDARAGLQAQREREALVGVEQRLQEDHLPIVIDAPLVDVPRSERVVK
ncbi:MAG TPA: DNA translocase FtsK 4TM domain-containing protein, partial [Burkholderiaceae bacterium]|nr:DNA translocase FtsK 4TM domain-containing protein [Burkholderiaceae bacterium]